VSLSNGLSSGRQAFSNSLYFNRQYLIPLRPGIWGSPCSPPRQRNTKPFDLPVDSRASHWRKVSPGSGWVYNHLTSGKQILISCHEPNMYGEMLKRQSSARLRETLSVREKMKKSILFLLGFFIIGSLINLDQSYGQTEIFVGKAVNISGQSEYTERHEVTFEEGKVIRSKTTYLDPSNRIIGDLVTEYMADPRLCSYDFRDMRAKYEDGVRVEGDRLRLFRKQNPSDEVELAHLPLMADQIVGQGFHHFIVLNLEAIASGEVFHVKLVMPSRLKQYKFRIRKRDLDNGTLSVRLEIDNWFLRLFAPHVDAEYDLKTRHLLRYDGISNLSDASGEYKKVIITYSY
jgi:hypothetical protein